MNKIKDVDWPVEMVDLENNPQRMTFTQHIDGFSSLGKEIKITPKAHVNRNKAGLKVEYFVPTISICVGVGKDHSFEIIMDEDTWTALNNGEPINVDTKKDFLKKYVIKRK